MPRLIIKIKQINCHQDMCGRARGANMLSLTPEVRHFCGTLVYMYKDLAFLFLKSLPAKLSKKETQWIQHIAEYLHLTGRMFQYRDSFSID